MALPAKMTDLEPAAWIGQNTTPLQSSESKDWKGNFVSHCIPPVYAAYCKVFHPIYEDLSIADHSLTWNDLKPEPEDEPDPIDRLLSDATITYGGEYDPKNLRPLSWRQLADQCGLRFHAEFNVDSFSRNFPRRSWPRYLIGPAEGTLETDVLKRIVRSIAVVTSDFDLSQRCYFHYDVIATTTYDNDLLFLGSLIDIFDTPTIEDVNTTPSNWWPITRDWFVSTDWDLAFTLIGGTAELINSLVSDPELDCLRVTSSTRIDYKSDQVNP